MHRMIRKCSAPFRIDHELKPRCAVDDSFKLGTCLSGMALLVQIRCCGSSCARELSFLLESHSGISWALASGVGTFLCSLSSDEAPSLTSCTLWSSWRGTRTYRISSFADGTLCFHSECTNRACGCYAYRRSWYPWSSLPILLATTP